MEANQITVRLDDEEYVRSVWVSVSYCSREETNSCCGPTVFIAPFLSGNKWTGEFRADAKDAVWSAAAEYTRERLEQVRQLREEIHRMECLLMPPPRVLIREAVEEMWPGDMALEYVREVCAYSRTIARLEAELATLTRGMKPEALEGATR